MQLTPLATIGGVLAGALLGSTLVPATAEGQAHRALGLTAEQAAILSHMHLVYETDGAGGRVPKLILTGLNLQIVNGLGATNGNPLDPLSVDPDATVTNGTGNLILGYDEPGPGAPDRGGSHNLVLGSANAYASFGGVVSGRSNRAEAPHAMALGGHDNLVQGPFAAAVAGSINEAKGAGAVTAGGSFNWASGEASAVLGSWRALASGSLASISGGYKPVASGFASAVHGGALNRAEGTLSSVSGGNGRIVTGEHDWAAGTLFEDE